MTPEASRTSLLRLLPVAFTLMLIPSALSAQAVNYTYDASFGRFVYWVDTPILFDAKVSIYENRFRNYCRRKDISLDNSKIITIPCVSFDAESERQLLDDGLFHNDDTTSVLPRVLKIRHMIQYLTIVYDDQHITYYFNKNRYDFIENFIVNFNEEDLPVNELSDYDTVFLVVGENMGLWCIKGYKVDKVFSFFTGSFVQPVEMVRYYIESFHKLPLLSRKPFYLPFSD